MGKNRKHHSYLLRYSSRDSIHSSTEFHDQSIINSAALVEGRWAPFPESAPKKICFIMDEGKRRPWPSWRRIARVVDAGWFKPPLQMVVILDRRWFVDCSGFAKDCWFCIFFSWFSDLPEIAWYIMVPYSIRFPSVFLLKWPFFRGHSWASGAATGRNPTTSGFFQKVSSFPAKIHLES